MFNFCIVLFCFFFFFKAAYEKMEEARRAMFELGKEVTRGFIQLTPDEIKLITDCKRVRQKINPYRSLSPARIDEKR